ncbi:MAG: hypothetical protein HOP15_10560 [Planctomycetes bacterium]|nr:hypothetical protein [Planctomycetota bacterium]
MKAREFDSVVAKFRMETRHGRDLHAWLTYEGKVLVRTKRSGGRDDHPKDLVRSQLKLDEQQLHAAIRCTFGREDYLAHLRKKGII